MCLAVGKGRAEGARGAWASTMQVELVAGEGAGEVPGAEALGLESWRAEVALGPREGCQGKGTPSPEGCRRPGRGGQSQARPGWRQGSISFGLPFSGLAGTDQRRGQPRS